MSLKSFVNTPKHWQAFEEKLGEKIAGTHRQLESVVELSEMYRLQGRLRAYRSLIKLRDEINQSED